MSTMKTRFFRSYTALFCMAMCATMVYGAEKRPVIVLTHADAAVFFAKYSGLFDRYVPIAADLSECVSFLNQTGIYFGLMEVVNGKEFDIGDCARVMGQIELVMSGEADYLAGKVILPKGIASWEDFCIMNGIFYKEGYDEVASALNRLR